MRMFSEALTILRSHLRPLCKIEYISLYFFKTFMFLSFLGWISNPKQIRTQSDTQSAKTKSATVERETISLSWQILTNASCNQSAAVKKRIKDPKFQTLGMIVHRRDKIRKGEAALLGKRRHWNQENNRCKLARTFELSVGLTIKGIATRPMVNTHIDTRRESER